MASDGKYGPSITLCRLFERTSAKGNVYLAGRLGGAKVAILKGEVLDDGVQTWNVVLQEAPAKVEGEREQRRTIRTEPDTPDYVNQDPDVTPPLTHRPRTKANYAAPHSAPAQRGPPPNEWDDPIPF